MRRVFIEVNPFHAGTLFALHGNFSGGSAGLIFGPERLLDEALVARLGSEKKPATLNAMLRGVMAPDVERCYFNTIDPILTPFAFTTTGPWLRTLAAVLCGRLSGKPIAGIAHDADHYFDTGVDSGRRAVWFRRLVGAWYVRLFQEVYVLTPEVHTFLTQRGIRVTLLDASPWRALAAAIAPTIEAGEPRPIAWIGPVEGFRRHWMSLLDLDASRLRATGARIVMICHGGWADGPRLRDELDKRGLLPFFQFFDHRPDDDELMRNVVNSAGLLCLYGSPEYSRVKSSGARIISFGLGKPFISATPEMGVYAADGQLIRAFPSLTDCVCALTTSGQ
jgi:hypothetical protein